MRKEMPIDFGPVNGHLIGFAMKEAMFRAMEKIRARQFVFKTTRKEDKRGREDFVTDADLAAQAVYLKLLHESFPTFGIVAEEREKKKRKKEKEEKSLNIPCTHPTHNIYFVVDPLDGTKAFIRRQSHGVGTMCAIVCDGKIIAAYVGDVNTQEIYGYRPGNNKTWRIGEFERRARLRIDKRLELKNQCVLLRDDPHLFSPHIQKLVAPQKEGGRFRNLEVGGGSIGICLARLWKGEIGAVVLQPGKNDPWDLHPILGISQRLGFIFVAIDPENGEMRPFCPLVVPTAINLEHETLIIHKSRWQN